MNDSLGHARGRPAADRRGGAVPRLRPRRRHRGAPRRRRVRHPDRALPAERPARVLERLLRRAWRTRSRSSGNQVPVTREHRRRHRGRRATRADELLRNADVAMYAAKRARQGPLRDLESRMYADVRERLEMEAALRPRHRARRAALHYQPIVSLADRRDLGVEALVRWEHPARGLLLPAALHPARRGDRPDRAARRAGCSSEACRQVQAWRAAHPQRPLAMAVNISGRQLQEPAISADVRAALAGTGLEPVGVVLEITESVLMQQTETVHRASAAAQGARRAARDRRLRHRLLVAQLPAALPDRHPQDRQAVRRRTSAPGAETRPWPARSSGWATRSSSTPSPRASSGRDQRDALLELGCDLGQGHYFSRALPPDGIARLLTARRAAAERRMSAASPLHDLN